MAYYAEIMPPIKKGERWMFHMMNHTVIEGTIADGMWFISLTNADDHNGRRGVDLMIVASNVAYMHRIAAAPEQITIAQAVEELKSIASQPVEGML